MGGMGSGRWGSHRRKVEHMLRLDIARLRRQGLSRSALMQVGWPSGASISLIRAATGLRLLYRSRSGEGEWQTVKELVPLVETQQRLGGHRRWFGCPGCGRRCRILYGGILHGAGRFRCRHCHRLCYSSQSEGIADRANRGMFKIVKKLDPDQRFNDLPPRPKHMRWETYKRLVERYERYDEQWAVEALRRFGIRR